MFSYFCKDEGCIIFKVDLSITNSCHRGRATAVCALTCLLRCGIHHLPTSHANWQIRSGHPAFIPYMKIPVLGRGKGSKRNKCETVIIPLYLCACSDFSHQRHSAKGGATGFYLLCSQHWNMYEFGAQALVVTMVT